jgi:hypothetical protein
MMVTTAMMLHTPKPQSTAYEWATQIVYNYRAVLLLLMLLLLTCPSI